MNRYVTIQGDTWDSIAYRLFGSEKYMKELIEANWPQAEVMVFSSGTVLNVPELKENYDDLDAPFWRRLEAYDKDTLPEYVEVLPDE